MHLLAAIPSPPPILSLFKDYKILSVIISVHSNLDVAQKNGRFTSIIAFTSSRINEGIIFGFLCNVGNCIGFFFFSSFRTRVTVRVLDKKKKREVIFAWTKTEPEGVERGGDRGCLRVYVGSSRGEESRGNRANPI